MLKIELVPTLERCIETVARKKHDELVQMLLESKAGDSRAQEKLDLLGLFLDIADFRKLRAESERHLIAGKTVRFAIYFEFSTCKYTMQVT